jgi:hypothetical protein
MKSKTILAAAVAGLISSTGALAFDNNISTTTGSELPMNVSEAPASIGTIHSLDTKTGGYKGWGPMANPQTPYNVDESKPDRYVELQREQQQQLAEVRQVRDQVWVANAPLRSEYENIGGTRSHAGGFGSFFHRGTK